MLDKLQENVNIFVTIWVDYNFFFWEFKSFGKLKEDYKLYR